MAKRKSKKPKRYRRIPQQRTGSSAAPFRVIQFAELKGVSECTYVSTKEASSFGYIRLLPLDHLHFADENAPAPTTGPGLQLGGLGARLLQGPQHSGWKRVGLISLPGSQSGGTFMVSGRVVETVHSQDVHMLFFDWRPQPLASAWDVFLTTQEKLRPQNMSLLPQFIVPFMFLTRMEDRIKSGLAARWLPHFDYSYRHSFALITGLFNHWVLERRCAAARQQYDQRLAHWGKLNLDNMTTPEQREAVEVFERYFGAKLGPIWEADRLEAAVIRSLDEVSFELWQEQARPKPDHIHLKALLPVALWRPEPPVPVEPVLRAGPDRLGEAWLRT
jgi:hypothetical protein